MTKKEESVLHLSNYVYTSAFCVISLGLKTQNIYPYVQPTNVTMNICFMSILRMPISPAPGNYLNTINYTFSQNTENRQVPFCKILTA